MKKLQRLLSLMMVLMMIAGMLAACGSSNNPAPASQSATATAAPASETASETPKLESVNLIMYLLGDRTKDFDLVMGKINEKLKADINATIEAKFLSWSEYEQKYPLIFASGESFDMVYSADWAFYNAQSTKGGFYEITKEALEKYAPLSAQTMYPEAWEQAKVNGKVYMLPMNYKELTAYIFMVRGDLMKKYGMDSINNIDDFEKYLDSVVKNDTQLIPLDIGSDFDMLFMFDRFWGQLVASKYDSVGPWQIPSYIEKGDATRTVKSIVSAPEYAQAVKKLKEWKDRGYWSKSAIVNTHTNKESFANGRSASGMMNINDAKGQFSKITKDHPEWDVKVFDAMGSQPATLCSFLANGMSIFAQSKNPERALMALDLLRNNESYHDLFAYGIEGVHYEKAGNGRIKLLEGTVNYPYDGNCNWGLRNDKFWKQVDGGIPNYEELYANWAKSAKPLTYGTFNFNDEKVKNQVAAINEIFKNEYKLLGLGFSQDVDSDIAKTLKKMETAGINDIYKVMQEQLKDFK